MKKDQQCKVFGDSESIGWVTGWKDPSTNDLPLESYYKSVLEKTGKGVDRLNYLISCCFPGNDYAAFERKAHDNFMIEAGRLFHKGKLSREEIELLTIAKGAGMVFKKLVKMDMYINDQNVIAFFEAIQKLIHIKPEVIRLPFIAEALINILRAYKYRPKITHSGLEKAWNGLLPKREHIGSPFTKKQIDFLKKREPHNANIAERLSLSEKSIRRKSTSKGLPGRPKKK